MALTKCTTDTAVIAGLGTTPQERGLTPDQFKAKFDEAGTGLKDYINDTLTAEVDTHIADLITDADGAHGLKIESGSFNPTVIGSTTAGTQTYAAQSGSYIKIGNLVFFTLYVAITAKDGAMAGNLRIGGLPVAPKTGSTIVRGVSIGRLLGLDTGKTGVMDVTGAIISNNQWIDMYISVDGATSAASQTAIPVSEVMTSFNVGISGFYETA